MKVSFPILEFDSQPQAILNPIRPHLQKELPRTGVLCFFQDVLDLWLQQGRLQPIGACASEMGTHIIYEMTRSGKSLFVLHPGVGAPLAAWLLEEMIAAGAQNIIACGGCGVLKPDINVGQVLIVTAAVRDEGTSYHYLPPARIVQADPGMVQTLQAACAELNTPYRSVNTWTTDGLYRETEARRALRIAEGCEVVEMEAAAFLAVSQFRRVNFGQVLYGGDLVVPEGWDERDWVRHGVRGLLLEIAVQAAMRLE